MNARYEDLKEVIKKSKVYDSIKWNKIVGRHKTKGGAYATVIIPSKYDFAIKIIDADNESTIKYLKFCYKNKTLKYLPKIYHYFKHNNQYFFFMEKLVGINRKHYEKIYNKYFRYLYHTKDDIPKSRLKGVRKILNIIITDHGRWHLLDTLDIHDENIMLRKKTNQWVLTDPIADCA